MVTQGTILSQRYLIEDELGTGGMGTVYRAVDLRTGARVAVKVPHSYLTRDVQYLERLKREAQIAASLHSPRVALVTDFSEHNGVPYLVMEYVAGENLDDRLEADGKMLPREALRITLEVARALEAADAAGIVHRDLKPQNIRLTQQDDVKVLDFGIARVVGQSGLTSTSIFLGSPDYAAPERAEGLGDIRSDIYSLGVTLYELLTGERPFGEGTPYTILRRHATIEPPPLPEGYPSSVYPIVERCLAKRPEDRYQTPGDLARDVAAALRELDNGPIAGTPSPPTPRTTAPPSPTVVGYTGVTRTRTAEAAAADTSPTGEQARLVAEPLLPIAPAEDRPRRDRRPLLIGAAAAILIGLVLVGMLIGRQMRSTDTTLVAPVPPGSAPAASVTFTQPAGGAQVRAPVTVAVTTEGLNLRPATANDPTGQHLHYFLDLDPSLVVGPGQPVPTGQANIIHTDQLRHTFAELTPGSHSVTVVATGNDHRPLTPPVQQSVSFTVLPALPPGRPGSEAPVAFQSQVEGKWTISVIRGDGQGLRRLTPPTSNNVNPAWSPDGAALAFSSDREGERRIFVMNADGSNPRRVTAGPGADTSPSWSPDGQSIVFQSSREGRNLLYAVPAAKRLAPRVVARWPDDRPRVGAPRRRVPLVQRDGHGRRTGGTGNRNGQRH